jgi:mono/diheme cytochrome c family protein
MRRFALLPGLLLAIAILAACSTAEADVARGEQLYAANCASCHGGRDSNPPLPAAPPHTDAGHTWHHSDQTLHGVITGELTFQGRTMPSFEGQLSGQEIADILAYIKTWWGPEQRQYQEQVTRNQDRQP